VSKEDKITKKFHDFKKKELEKNRPADNEQNLSSDIEILKKLDNGEYTKASGSFDIVKIIGIITDENEVNKLEEASGGFQLSTDLTVKEIKRGDIIWLTALLKRPHATTAFNQTTMGVIKARIIDYYYGLNKLKYINSEEIKK
jgi:hypothetical protein